MAKSTQPNELGDFNTALMKAASYWQLATGSIQILIGILNKYESDN